MKTSRISSIQSALSFPFRLSVFIISSAWFPAVVLIAYFLVYAINFTILLNPLVAERYIIFGVTGSGVNVPVDVEKAAEAIKSSIGLGFYVLSVLLMLVHFREMLGFARKNYHLIFMFMLPLIGMYISVIPEKVLYSVIQLISGFLIALAYAFTRTNWSLSFVRLCKLVLFPFAIVHFGGIALIFLHEIDIGQFFEGTARFGGLGGNPNSLGASATVGSWLSLYLLMDKTPSKALKLWAALCLLIFLFSIITSLSGTSKATVAMVFSVMLLARMYFLAKSNNTKLIYAFSLPLIIIAISGSFFINNSFTDLQLSATSGLGKDTSLTGRTEIWEIGLGAVVDRPILGWGLDSHETVLGYDTYEIPYGIKHYHNGFIDTAVSSGMLVLLLVFYNLSKYIKLLFVNIQKNKWSFGMVGPFIIIIMHNLSEYSVMRPLNVVYQLYLVAFCMLAVSAYYRENDMSSLDKKVRIRKKGKSRKGHYRFG